jgi:membrane protein YqaA with SNARE-associated domain|tara:strand:+ start:41899 stop:42510 length:612 start_codon:yes stop_codon:yes gene_type:complete
MKPKVETKQKMNLFGNLYARVMAWAEHRRATFYLSVLSFAESSFFPIPPDVMLAPMALRQPHRAFYFAFLTTVFSVLGGILGYFIGRYSLDLAEQLLQDNGYWPLYQQARAWFQGWGLWVVLIAGFSPIPYKLFTVTAGAMGQPLIAFILASVLGRGSRFFLLALLIKLFGQKIERHLLRYIEYIGWLLVVLIVLAIIGVNLK